MEKLNNGFTLELSEDSFPLSTDSMALADFVKLPKNARVLDLGSGCGTLGLLLCAKDESCTVTGVEIGRDDHSMALHNAEVNNITERLNSICADVCQVPTFIRPGSFSVCVSNPPYFTGGPKSKTTPTARCEDLLPLDALFSGAAWALKYGGDFFLVHKPERLAEIFATAAKYSLEPKELQLLRHRAEGGISLVLVKCRKGAKPGLKWSEQHLHDALGNKSDYYKQIYHL
ncbi:MAG: methyltransferase [Oscillospiraceae bacterium]|nr:methyltransferase [Oscillospiraceae bacterium]